MPTLLAELKELIERHPEADFYELQCLRLAGDLLVLCREELFGERISESIWPRMTRDEYFKLPDRFELIEGRARPKDWEMYVEAQARKKRAGS